MDFMDERIAYAVWLAEGRRATDAEPDFEHRDFTASDQCWDAYTLIYSTVTGGSWEGDLDE